MARRAFVIHREAPTAREERLCRILTFFGVPWASLGVSDLVNAQRRGVGDEPYGILGSVDTLAEALSISAAAEVVDAADTLYAYGASDRSASLRALGTVAGGNWKWVTSSSGAAYVDITDRCPALTGPMSGIRLTAPIADEHATVAESDAGEDVTPIISLNGAPAFLAFFRRGVPAYFAASAAIVDIDEPVRRNYYDVKEHFLSAVPLVMFITSAFREVMWRSDEHGACLIIDDPLLKNRYGFCDFPRLRDLMRQHRFTTSIAFIPWNWRRTTHQASEFFRREADLFSVSVHGCDHMAAEFGATSFDAIDGRARLAQMRMRKHRARTGIQHDPVMVFPQGVFSSSCPGILKRNEFVAAVNTEISPVDAAAPATLVRDVWDTAILRYGSFPIYTRRYEHHGVENFAFDLLLGKPCFIVAHHDVFRDGGTALVTLIEKLQALNCTLHWRSPRQVVRRAYRSRNEGGRVRVQMYGTEVLLRNAADGVSEFTIQKRESEPSVVAAVAQDGGDVKWWPTPEGVEFHCAVRPHSEALVSVRYQGFVERQTPVSVKYALSVAARRIFCELRDEYVQRLYPRAVGGAAGQGHRQPETTGAANL